MRLTLAVAAILASVVPIASQQRPDFSGEWLLVPEASAPSDQVVMGTRVRLVHKTSELAVEMTFHFIAAGASTSVDSNEFDAPKRYVLDGGEHQMPGQGPTGRFSSPGGVRLGTLMPRWPTVGHYRATWTGDKLVLISKDELPVSSSGALRFVQGTIWTGFSYSSDGALVVERLSLFEPVAGSRQQPVPTPVRSVYRRVK